MGLRNTDTHHFTGQEVQRESRVDGWGLDCGCCHHSAVCHVSLPSSVPGAILRLASPWLQDE